MKKHECEGCHIHGTEDDKIYPVCSDCLSIIHKTWDVNKDLYTYITNLLAQNTKCQEALKKIRDADDHDYLFVELQEIANKALEEK